MFVLARYLLEPDGYGVLYWAIGVLAIIQLFVDLGLSRSVARYISEYREADLGQDPAPAQVHGHGQTHPDRVRLLRPVALSRADRGCARRTGCGPFLAAGVIYLGVFFL